MTEIRRNPRMKTRQKKQIKQGKERISLNCFNIKKKLKKIWGMVRKFEKGNKWKENANKELDQAFKKLTQKMDRVYLFLMKRMLLLQKCWKPHCSMKSKLRQFMRKMWTHRKLQIHSLYSLFINYIR